MSFAARYYSWSGRRRRFFADSDWGDKMIQCKDCEFCEVGADGRSNFKCDPFGNIKEPECIAKWQLIRLDMLVASYQGMMKWYGKLAPIQDKLITYMQREINELDETESWKLDVDEDVDDDEEEEIL
jgi:hypothetical protein